MTLTHQGATFTWQELCEAQWNLSMLRCPGATVPVLFARWIFFQRIEQLRK